MKDDNLVTESREFGLSHSDFFRIFPRVWPRHETLGEHQVQLDIDQRAKVRIRLGPQLYRRLATLKIPYMNMEFEFTAMDETQRAEFFKKFERAFQKGGG